MAQDKPDAVNEQLIFVDDVVCRADNPGVVGLCTDTSYESDVEEDDSDEEEPPEPGHCRVSWIDGCSPVDIEQSELQLRAILLDIPRSTSLLLGDIVAHPQNKKMLGTVTGVSLKVVLKDLDIGSLVETWADNLQMWWRINEGQLVFWKGWMGIVQEIKQRVLIRFENDSVAWCDVDERLEDSKDDLMEDDSAFAESRLHFGAYVRGSKYDFSRRNPKWIKGKVPGNGKGRVINHRPHAVNVQWLGRSLTEIDSGHFINAQAPPAHVLLKDARDLRVYWSSAGKTRLALGDIVRMTYSSFADESSPMLCSAYVDEATTTGIDLAYRIVGTQTSVSVEWQDGTEEHGIPSKTLHPPTLVDDTALWPADLVWNRMGEFGPGSGQEADQGTEEPLRIGVVQKVDAEQRTALVCWFKDIRTLDTLEGEAELCSLYAISSYPYSNVGLMDRVMLVDAPVSVDNTINWFGEVTKMSTDGHYDVLLANNEVVSVVPTKLVLIDPHGEDDEHYHEHSGDEYGSGDDFGWEDMDDDYVTADEEDSSDEHLDEPQTGETAVPQPVVQAPAVSEPATPDAVTSEAFELLDDEPVLHNLTAKLPPHVSNKLPRRMVSEHGILQSSLPAGIYVRAYSERMDVLQAMIVGSTGTPYQEGLFLFDVYLPNAYPAVPPKAHYHSVSGGKINPNLYEDGSVCLSLLHTWHGSGSEAWTADSNILQLLVSIQGLVLNKEPYYNEAWLSAAGYQKFVGTTEGRINSQMYSEKCYALSLKTLVHYLRHPPTAFESVIHKLYFEQGRLDRAIATLSGLIDAEPAAVGVNAPLMQPPSVGCTLLLRSQLAELKRLREARK
ncbi:hypothetical protein RI367_006584 [Sorochytrium milnesiophthora]